MIALKSLSLIFIKSVIERIKASLTAVPPPNPLKPFTGIKPDLICCGKGMGGGIAVSGVIGKKNRPFIWVLIDKSNKQQ